MIKKHAVLIGIVFSLVLLVIAAIYYPGGSQIDKNSIGYDWKNNYMSNLFSPKAVNGLDNASRPWAMAGMFFLCTSCAIFFTSFSKRIPPGAAAGIIKYSGAGAALFVFLTVTPYHDLMIGLSSTCILIAIFYLSVIILKSKLLFFKFLSIACLVTLYLCIYMYYTRSFLNLLPIMQKVCFLTILTWMVGLEYLSKKEDFLQTNKGKTSTGKEATTR